MTNDFIARGYAFLSPTAFILSCTLPRGRNIDAEDAGRICRASILVYSFAKAMVGEEVKEKTELGHSEGSSTQATPLEPVETVETDLSPKLLSTFNFPEFSRDVVNCEIDIRSDPQPCTQNYSASAFKRTQDDPVESSSSSSLPPTSAKLPLNKPFYPEPLTRIFVLSWDIALERRTGRLRRGLVRMEEEHYTIFIHSDGELISLYSCS